MSDATTSTTGATPAPTTTAASPAATAPASTSKYRSVAGQAPYPDALKVPIGWRGTATNKFQRANTLFDAVEPLLGVGFGEVEARNQIGFYFITRRDHVGHQHGMYFHASHPRTPKQPRYTWEARPDIGPGVFFGWLNDQAKEEVAMMADAGTFMSHDEFTAAFDAAWAANT